MSLTAASLNSEPSATPTYRFLRQTLRIWFSVNFHRIRVLQSEQLTAIGPALLVVNHPASFLDSLLLTAALERPVRCLVGSSLLQKPFARAWARGLEFIESAEGDGAGASVLNASCEVLKQGGAVLVFAGEQPVKSMPSSPAADSVPAIAIEAQACLPAATRLPVHPVHLLLPVPPSQSSEILIHIDAALRVPNGSDGATEGSEASGQAFGNALERACRENPFRIRSGEVEQLLAAIESAMREEFDERWSRRPNSKQCVDDFDLSPYLVRLVHKLNTRHPGRLAALSEAFRAYQERRRQLALITLRTETAGPWFRSGIRRLAAWIESIPGLPVAAYGLINLLPAWLILRLMRSFRQGFWDVPAGTWMVRLMVALACYAGEVVIAALFLPRWEVGYYAPSLLASGAYLLRYLWLLNSRTSIVVSNLERKRRARRLRLMRRKLIAELNRDQERFAERRDSLHASSRDRH
jgi:hypothetical protein